MLEEKFQNINKEKQISRFIMSLLCFSLLIIILTSYPLDSCNISVITYAHQGENHNIRGEE